MPDLPSPLKILSQLGLTKSLQRIKFGGVVGKQTLLAVIGACAIAAIAWRSDPAYAWIFGICAVVLLLVVAVLNFWYAHAHPAEAMLEGTEMLAFQHQMLAAKFLQPPKDSAIIPNPENKPPELNPSEAPDQ